MDSYRKGFELDPPSENPLSRPAATKRSPNRRDRWRGKARSNALKTKKTRIIQAVAIGHTRPEAAVEAGTTPSAVGRLERQDANFKEVLLNAEETARQYRAMAAGVIDGELEAIAKRVVQTVQETKDEKLLVDGGIKLLKGRGVLVDKSLQEMEVPKGVNIRRIEIVEVSRGDD